MIIDTAFFFYGFALVWAISGTLLFYIAGKGKKKNNRSNNRKKMGRE